jgi:hypothetical protein
MTTCASCGTANLAGSQYCDECGEFLPAAPSESSVTSSKSNGLSPTGELAMPLAAQVEDVAASGVTNSYPGSGSVIVENSNHKPVKPKPSADPVARMEGAHAKLVIERGRSSGKQFPLSSEESQIGRWDADGGVFPDVDLDADDPEAKVSRRHARIVRRSGQYLIEDLGSTNGTFINRGRRLLPGNRQPLRDGDEIIVGKTFMRFHLIH